MTSTFSQVLCKKDKCKKACTSDYDLTCVRYATGETERFSNPCVRDMAICYRGITGNYYLIKWNKNK